MSFLVITAGKGYDSDLQSRVHRNTVTVGEIRQKIRNTSDSVPLVIKHNGDLIPITGIKTTLPLLVTAVAGETGKYTVFCDRMRSDTLTAGDLRRAMKQIPEKCPMTVRYQDGSIAPIYSLERDG